MNIEHYDSGYRGKLELEQETRYFLGGFILGVSSVFYKASGFRQLFWSSGRRKVAEYDPAVTSKFMFG